jgi:predicted CopG family antitoxin
MTTAYKPLGIKPETYERLKKFKNKLDVKKSVASFDDAVAELLKRAGY